MHILMIKETICAIEKCFYTDKIGFYSYKDVLNQLSYSGDSLKKTRPQNKY